MSATTVFDYLKACLFVFLAKISGRERVVFSLPAEVEYPYIFRRFWRGLSFINFVEKLKKIANIRIVWKITLSSRYGKTSMDLVPKNIEIEGV